MQGHAGAASTQRRPDALPAAGHGVDRPLRAGNLAQLAGGAWGAPKEDRDTVGRWTPKDSDDYVRHYKAVVKRLLIKIVTGVAFDTLDEQGNMQELLDAVVKSGVDVEQATEEISTLTSDSRVWLLFVTNPSPSPPILLV